MSAPTTPRPGPLAVAMSLHRLRAIRRGLRALESTYAGSGGTHRQVSRLCGRIAAELDFVIDALDPKG